MRLPLLCLLLLVWCPRPGLGQAQLSPEGWLLLDDWSHNPAAKTSDAFMSRWPVSIEPSGEVWVSALLEWRDRPDAQALARLGAQGGEPINGIQTVRLPLGRLSELLAVPGLQQVHLRERAFPTLDTGRVDVGGDALHLGLGLPRPFRGAGVVVGIVDGGFDYSQPVFRDPETGRLRVSRAWHQRDPTGPPPAGFRQGTELVGEAALLAAGHDQPNQSHGTHVATIAAGSGIGPERRLRGMAPEAELVFVSTDFTEQGILDGIRYIFRYAELVGRPAVVNLSIGGRVGPRDGSSAFDRAVEGLVGPGAFVVGAAGNAGRLPNHLFYRFSRDTVRTVLTLPADGSTTVADCWTERAGRLAGRIEVYDTVARLLHRFADFSTDRSALNRRDSLPLPDDRWLRLRASSIPRIQNTNNKGRLVFVVETNAADRCFPVLTLWADTGAVHAWNSSETLVDTLPNGRLVPGAVAGDTRFTINEIGGTGRRTFTVGAYTTTTQFSSLTEGPQTVFFPAPIGDLGSFSSRGPSTDDRIKPELTAPGNAILSGLSSADPYYRNLIAEEYREGERSWFFGYQHGTSMAAPFVTGTVALLLQVNPRLTYAQIRELLLASARADDFTGRVADGSPDWGFGKLDALQAVRDLLASPIGRSGGLRELPLRLWPNPVEAGGRVQVAGLLPDPLADWAWYDGLGRCVGTGTTANSMLTVPDIPGLYTLSIAQSGQMTSLRVLVR